MMIKLLMLLLFWFVSTSVVITFILEINDGRWWSIETVDKCPGEGKAKYFVWIDNDHIKNHTSDKVT